MKILIASQDGFQARGIQWLLESSITEIQVFIVEELQSAIHMIENDKPHLVILEMEMAAGPNLEELMTALCIIQPAILSITSEATFEAAKKAMDIGSRSLLVKPFMPQELVQKTQIVIKELREKVEAAKDQPSKVSQEIEYRHLFLPSQKVEKSYILAAIIPENPAFLETLLEKAEKFPFPVHPMLFPFNKETICVFERKREILWEEIFKRFMLEWNQIYPHSLAIFIHEGMDTGSSLYKVFEETRNAWKLTFFNGYQQVHAFSEPIQWRFIDPLLTPEEQKRWIQSLNDGNKNQIQGILYKEFLHFSYPYPDPELIRIRLTSILAQIRRYMKTYLHEQKKQHEEAYLNMFDTILKESVVYRIIQKLFLFTSHIIDEVRAEPDLFVNNVIEKCLHFIELNYWNNQLDLQVLSQYVKRNPSYISHLFRVKKQAAFREVLNEIRVKHAKKHLLETSVSMKEIAALTGFQNQQYFSKIFHKHTGLTPKQFRNSHSVNET